MRKRRLPTADEALATLREIGDQFASSPCNPHIVGGVTFQHPKKGELLVKADKLVLQAISRLYITDRKLRRVIRARKARACRFARTQLLWLLAKCYLRPKLIVGVSGFASKGYSCEDQYVALDECYRFFTETAGQQPQLVVDGAAGAGVLGINGVLAANYDIATLGVNPLQGTSTMAPRTHMWFYRHTYRQREEAVGTLVDALVCIDGGEGTMREALATLHGGGVVLLVAPNGGGSHTFAGQWQTHAELQKAQMAGRFIVCSSLNELHASLQSVCMAAQSRRRYRWQRFAWVAAAMLRQR